MSMFYYVDTKETLKDPLPGKQFVAWYNRGSINNPGGYPHVDVINGEEVEIRSFDEVAMARFLKVAYARAPYIKVKQIFEESVE